MDNENYYANANGTRKIYLFVYHRLPDNGEPVYVGTEQEEKEWRAGWGGLGPITLLKKLEFPDQQHIAELLQRVDGTCIGAGRPRIHFSQILGLVYREARGEHCDFVDVA